MPHESDLYIAQLSLSLSGVNKDMLQPWRLKQGGLTGFNTNLSLSLFFFRSSYSNTKPVSEFFLLYLAKSWDNVFSTLFHGMQGTFLILIDDISY